ncbi:MAG: hypothetical protein N2487_03455 [Verrucomicrobiae bacterium]|nr:hypothetical protein [Verrucomicrobiae bacterium]
MPEKEIMEKLKELISQREERFYLSGGEIFVLWGALSILAHNIYNLLLQHILVWIGMIILGNAAMITYVSIACKGGYKTFWGKMLLEFWGGLTLLLVFVFYLFPFVFKLYPPVAIYPLILFMLSIGMYVSGIITESVVFKLGGVAFLISSVLIAHNTTWFFWGYNAAAFFGLVIPGIWSRYEKRK